MRYEFRTFSQSAESEKKLLELPDYWSGEMTDKYLLTGRKDIIIKVRDGEIKSKQLIGEKGNFQLWETTYPPSAPSLPMIEITKSRVMKYDGRCGADISRFTLNGKEYKTIGLESISLESLFETKEALQLLGKNKSYAEFLLEATKNE